MLVGVDKRNSGVGNVRTHLLKTRDGHGSAWTSRDKGSEPVPHSSAKDAHEWGIPMCGPRASRIS